MSFLKFEITVARKRPSSAEYEFPYVYLADEKNFFRRVSLTFLMRHKNHGGRPTIGSAGSPNL